MLQIVAAEFRAKRVTVARHTAQGDAEEHLAHPAPVEGRRVDEVEPAIERDAHGVERFVELHAAEFLAERGGAEAENGQVKVSLTKPAGLHF